MGVKPKDFDISTTARPRQVKRLIRNSYIIGKRFRLVLVRKVDGTQYEISTFRRNLLPGENPEDLPQGDNIFGSPQQDASRRDYTCNALFYDPIKREVIDHTGGLRDLKSGWVKLIGKPEERLPEDAIRILRAVRFSEKLNLQIEPNLLQGLEDFSDELKVSPLPRKREEYLKILRLKKPGLCFLKLKDLRILNATLPYLEDQLKSHETTRDFKNAIDHFDQSHRIELEPTSLFGLLIWSLATALNPNGTYEDLYNWVTKEEVQNFAKHELGVFNTELTQVEQAFKILPNLEDYESFKRKGERRQFGFLSQKALPLALMLYTQDHGANRSQWLEVFAHFSATESLLFPPADENNIET